MTWMPTLAFARGRLSVGMTVRGVEPCRNFWPPI
jgi:hypothetical protein